MISPPPGLVSNGWSVNKDGTVFVIINGSAYEVDPKGTKLAKLPPGEYTDDDVARLANSAAKAIHMPINPHEDEDQKTFMSRCMHELSQSDTERSQEQKLAICFAAWRRGPSEKDVGELAELLEDINKIMHQPRDGHGRYSMMTCPACGFRFRRRGEKSDDTDQD